MGTRAAWPSTKVRRRGGRPAGAAGPRGRRAHRVPSAAPSGALLGRVPLPHPPEAKGGVGSPPQPGPPGPGQALFSCLLFQSRAPHPKLKEFWGESREQGVNSLIPAPPVLGLSRECLPARYPPPLPPGLFWFPLREEEVKGGSSSFASGCWEERNWEGRRRVPREKGLLKSSGEELRLGEQWFRGPEWRRGRFGVSPSSTWIGS